MVHPEPTSVEWRYALHECVASRSLSVLHERTLLVFVDPRETFHPLHALLPRDMSERAFIAILQLHEGAVALAHALQDASAQIDEHERAQVHRTVLESLVFADCAVDPTSAKRTLDTNSSGRTAHAVPLFCARRVNFRSGALCAPVADAASASAVLAQVTIALQTCAPLDVVDAFEPLTVVVEHCGGEYVAQQYVRGVVQSATRVKQRTLESSDSNTNSTNSNITTLDAVLETYERDFVIAVELAGLDYSLQQQQQLAVRVRAGYRIVPANDAAQLNSSSSSSSSSSRRYGRHLDATLLTNWHGIEHVQALGAKPPPHASAVVCISTVDNDDAISRDHSKAHVEATRLSTTAAAHGVNASFAVRVQHTIAFITQLEQAASDAVVDWPNDAQASESALADPQAVVHALQQFLREPHTGAASSSTTTTTKATTMWKAEDAAGDTNTTLELAIAFRATRTSDARNDNCPNRTDCDFLERLWQFALAHVATRDAAVALVQELVATFAAARTIPLVHAANPTHLAAFLTSRVAGKSTAALLERSFAALSSSCGALLALAELGQWTLQRDVAAWLTHCGFTATESACLVEQLAVPIDSLDCCNSDALDRRTYRRTVLQQLMDVCELAYALGVTGPLLRRLASDCLRIAATHEQRSSRLTDERMPAMAVPLGAFIPERIRAQLGDALFWDLEISLGERMQRTVRVCDATFASNSTARLSGVIRSSSDEDDEHNRDGICSKAGLFALDGTTLAQLQARLAAASTSFVQILHALQTFIESQQSIEERCRDSMQPLPSPVAGLVLVECTTRRL